MKYADGTSYQGGWKEDQQHGYGTFTDEFGISK